MGLIDFVKDAGRKMLGIDDDDKPKAKAATPVSPAEMAVKRAKALTAVVRETGIPVNNVSISVNGDVATIRGKVATQAEKEKVVLAIGNTFGVARVDDQLLVEKPEPQATLYTVKKGDTLWAIAKAHYKDGNKYPTIFEANKPMLADPDKIYPGQVLRIPPAA